MKVGEKSHPVRERGEVQDTAVHSGPIARIRFPNADQEPWATEYTMIEGVLNLAKAIIF